MSLNRCFMKDSMLLNRAYSVGFASDSDSVLLSSMITVIANFFYRVSLGCNLPNSTLVNIFCILENDIGI